MGGNKAILSDIKDCKDKQDIERYEKLKSCKVHPLDKIEGSWHPIHIWERFTFSYTKDLLHHGRKFHLTEDVYPPLRKGQSIHANL